MIYVIHEQNYDCFTILGYTQTADEADEWIENYSKPYKEQRAAAIIHNELLYKEWVENNDKEGYECWLTKVSHSSEISYQDYFYSKPYLDRIKIKIEGLKDLFQFPVPYLKYDIVELLE